MAIADDVYFDTASEFQDKLEDIVANGSDSVAVFFMMWTETLNFLHALVVSVREPATGL